MTLLHDLDLKMPFLITPQTTTDRIRMIDSVSTGFLYVVAQYSTTGGDNWEVNKQTAYFEQVRDMHLKTLPWLVLVFHQRTNFLLHALMQMAELSVAPSSGLLKTVAT